MGMFLRRGPAPHRTRMSDLGIGDSIQLNLNGTPWDCLVVHQGLPSSIYDASCDGTWLLMMDIYENRVWQSGNINKYESSDIYTYLNNPFLNLFDGNIKGAIKQVKIPYPKNGGSGGTDQNGANALLCQVFPLSGYEVGWTASDDQYFPKDGTKLSYFESGTGTAAKNKRIANLNGSAAIWLLRSPSTMNTASVWHVRSDGNYKREGAYASGGIRPAIILPSDTLVTDDMLS